SSLLDAGRDHDSKDVKTQERHPCNVCGDCFDDERQLFAHLRDVHIREILYPCGLCSETFPSSSRLAAHMCTHTDVKSLHCQVCKKRLSSLYNLRVHMRTHTGERPYSCDLCSKNFRTKSSMDAHKLTHSDERSFQCEICDSRWKSKYNLNTHMNTHYRAKSFSCEFCDQKYQNERLLQKHMVLHGASTSFSCEICHRQFKSKRTLQAHKSSHSTPESNHKPFPCYCCGERYETLQLLDHHMITHLSDNQVSREMHVEPSQDSEESLKDSDTNNLRRPSTSGNYYKYARMTSDSQDQNVHKPQELRHEDIASTPSYQEISGQGASSKGRNSIWSCIPETGPIVEETGWIWDELVGSSHVLGSSENE
ncbi:hypothetical protein QAD02_011940, partial [Eretmocerus hayati]